MPDKRGLAVQNVEDLVSGISQYLTEIFLGRFKTNCLITGGHQSSGYHKHRYYRPCRPREDNSCACNFHSAYH